MAWIIAKNFARRNVEPSGAGQAGTLIKVMPVTTVAGIFG